MYLRLLAESMRRGTRRKLLAVTAVALGTLGATALAEVMLASGDRLAAEMSSYGANVEVVPAPGRDTVPAAELAKVRRIFWRNNIRAIAPLHPLRVRFEASASATPAASAVPPAPGWVAPLVGTWFDHPLEPSFSTGLPRTRPTLRVDGRWPREGEAEVVLGRRLARRLGGAGTVGGTVEVTLGGRTETFRVVGTVASGGEEDEQAFAPLERVEPLVGPGRAPSFTRAEVFALTNPEAANVRSPERMSPAEYDAWYCTAYPSSVAFQIGEALPAVRAAVVLGVTGATADVLGKLRGILAALAVVALGGAAVGVTAAMTATVLERRLEAGLLVAIGAPRRRVVFFFLSEAALLGLTGGTIGGLLGLVAGRLLGGGALGIDVGWTWILLPFAALLGLAVAVLASLVPVSRALGRYPALVLKRATA